MQSVSFSLSIYLTVNNAVRLHHAGHCAGLDVVLFGILFLTALYVYKVSLSRQTVTPLPGGIELSNDPR